MFCSIACHKTFNKPDRAERLFYFL